LKALETEVIAFSSRGKSDTEKTQQLLTPDFSLVPGPQIDIMKSYGVFNDEKKVAKPAAFVVDKKGICDGGMWARTITTGRIRPRSLKKSEI